MEPKIIKTKDYIEFIGHYDDIAKCAKLSALASLYAIDSKVGYAKFPIEYEKDIYKALSCDNIFDYYTYYFCAYNSKYTTTTITAYLYHVDCYLGYPIYKNITNSTLKINMSSNEGSSNRSVVIIDNDTGTTLGTITSSSFTINAKLKDNGYFELYSFSGSNKTLSGHGTKLVKNQHYSETCSIYLQCESGSLFPYVVINLTAPPSPLAKTYNLDIFSNNSEEFNQIIVNGTSTDNSTFSTIDNIHYINTSTSSNVTVYSNSSWTSHYNSVLDYITTAPNVTAINSDCNSIITFTTHQVDPAGVISIGTHPLSVSYIGTSEVNKIYSGTSLVYEKQASAFTVDITLNNSGDLTWGNVYIYDGQDSTGALLYSKEQNIPTTITTSVQCSTGYLNIQGTANGDPQDSIALNNLSSNNVIVSSEADGSWFDGTYQIIGNATLVANCYYSY